MGYTYSFTEDQMRMKIGTGREKIIFQCSDSNYPEWMLQFIEWGLRRGKSDEESNLLCPCFNIKFIKQSAYICKLCVDFSCILSLFLILSMWTSTCGLFRYQVEFFSRRFFPFILFYVAELYFPLVFLVFLTIFFPWIIFWASQVVKKKNLPANAADVRDAGWIPGLGKSHGGNGYPLPYSYLENSIDRGNWWVTVYGSAKSRTWLERLNMHSQAESQPSLIAMFWLLPSSELVWVSEETKYK